MTNDPPKTLERFFSITPETIQADLQQGAEDIRSLLRESRALEALPVESLTPEHEARLLHLQLIEAAYVASDDVFAPEVKTFYAAFAAGHVAQDAEIIAADQESCARISAQMHEIRQREGLTEGQSWELSQEGPDDYRRLDDEFGEVLSRVADTVIPFVLRRYGLNEAADLFEQDRAEFEIQREIGRRVVVPSQNEEIAKVFEKGFVREYGAEALARVVARAAQLRGT